jgi:4-hydroxy-3-methylbut-2-enyl diphosphate reductase
MDRLQPKVEIDSSAGFCSGVRRAIEATEHLLMLPDDVFCLGEIVHNEAELSRLGHLGLKVLGDVANPVVSPGSQVIIRAHGEPPSTYERLNAAGAKITDATCPVVIRLQQKVGKASAEMVEAGGSVVIFGKPDHPEIKGLLGNTEGNAMVIASLEELDKIDLSGPLRVFSQTTSDLEAYQEFCEAVLSGAGKISGPQRDVIIHQTVCRQVSRRKPDLERFALSHDVVVFVSGSGSSNGKYLSEICKALNPNTFIVEGVGKVKAGWFADASSIGVSGATSTPLWLMQQVAGEISELLKNR